MKRTSALSLTIAGAIGLAAGYLTDQLLTWAKQPTFTPAWSLPALLVLLAIACLALAWPIRQRLRGKRKESVDGVRSLRIVTLARSSSLVGAVAASFALGLLLFLLTRGVEPQVSSVTVIGATIAAAVVLVISALVAESFCVLPKDDDDNPSGINTQP